MDILIEDLIKMMDKEDMEMEKEKEKFSMKGDASSEVFDSIPEKGSMRKIKLSDRNPDQSQDPREGKAESDHKPYIPSYQTNATSEESKVLIPSNTDEERPPLFYGVYNIQPQGNHNHNL